MMNVSTVASALRLALVLVLASAAAGCGEGSVETDIRPMLPEGDSRAGDELERLEVEVWPAASDVCRLLAAWRRSVCGGACTPPPIPSGMPSVTSSVIRTDGGWTAEHVSVPGGGPWQIVVRGKDASGNPFLYGCAVVESGMPTDVRLWRPWCDVAACAGQFHPACPVDIDCSASLAEDPDGLGPPRCRALLPVAWSYEQAGRSCEPTGDSYFAPCRPARVSCVAGATTAERDGVCPSTGATMCGAAPADDMDCDGRLPGPCGSCMSGATTPCGPAGACAGMATCEAGGTWGSCVLRVGVAEACGGGDQDCDGLDDGDDPDALAACNVGGPLADRCAADGCKCGSGPACAAGQRCSGGACTSGSDGGVPDAGSGDAGPRDAGVDAGRDAGRFDACVPNEEQCDDREPVDQDCDGVPDELDPDALAACNEGRSEGRPRADVCGPAGCRCAGGPACDGATSCCGDGCVDTMTSNMNCGRCGMPCEGPTTCVAGVCEGG